MLRRLEDGIELAAERGCAIVRVRAASRPWDDAVLDLRWELADNGLTAEASVRTLDGDGIASWMAELAESYRRWQGVRRWESLEHDACIQAMHDGRGHVGLRFVLRGPRGYEPHAWEASVSVTLDAGEDMRNLAIEIAAAVL